tara:strand:- start:693 stop:1187 length:495 start_codon:yes stop_codon:yes gene_type:complete
MAVLVKEIVGLGTMFPLLLALPTVFGALAASMMLFANPLAILGMASFAATMLATAAAANLMGVEFAASIQTISESIDSIPTTKNVEFVASMGALAAANTAAAALGSVNAVTNVITGNANQSSGTSASPTPYEVTINVMLDREKLATVTKEIVGEMSRDAARQGA